MKPRRRSRSLSPYSSDRVSRRSRTLLGTFSERLPTQHQGARLGHGDRYGPSQRRRRRAGRDVPRARDCAPQRVRVVRSNYRGPLREVRPTRRRNVGSASHRASDPRLNGGLIAFNDRFEQPGDGFGSILLKNSLEIERLLGYADGRALRGSCGMMGQQGGGQKRLFYSFNLDDHVPARSSATRYRSVS